MTRASAAVARAERPCRGIACWRPTEPTMKLIRHPCCDALHRARAAARKKGAR